LRNNSITERTLAYDAGTKLNVLAAVPEEDLLGRDTETAFTQDVWIAGKVSGRGTEGIVCIKSRACSHVGTGRQ